MTSELHIIDRRARGLERAVLAYSITGGDRVPILLDRTLASLAGVRRWLSEVPGARRDLIRDYLVVTAATLHGAGIDPSRVPHDLDAFERWIASEPTHGPAWCRPRTATLKAWCAVGEGLLGCVRELVSRMAPSLGGGEEWQPDDDEDAPWRWALIVDPDELRADAEDEAVSVTVTMLDRDAADAELVNMYAVVVEVWGGCTLAVGYDPDDVASGQYMLRGLAGGLPRWLFWGRELADAPGTRAIANTDPPAYRAPFTRELVAAHGLLDPWPHTT